jgi:hypothetical protein
LNQLQAELKQEHPTWDFQILGMNQLGHEGGNPTMTAGRTLPWLQDIDSDGDRQSDNFMNAWDYEYRDVVIVGADSRQVDVYNLTLNNLSDAANYATLKQKFVDAIQTTQSGTWTNPDEALDVNDDTFISPLDSLLVLNELNSVGAHQLPSSGSSGGPPPYLDPTGDGFVSPMDALLVINHLNAINFIQGPVDALPVASSSAAEGEPAEATVRAAATADSLVAAAVDEFFFSGDTGDSHKRLGVAGVRGNELA